MKSLRRTLILTAAAVLALGAAYAALTMAPAPTVAGPIVLTAVEPVGIASVQVANGTGTYRYYYEGDGYVLDDIPGTIADLDAFIGFMTNAGQLAAIRRVEGGTLAEYGLDSPAAVVDIAFFQGKAFRLAIGRQEPVSGAYYVTAEGGVYLMPSAMAAPFLAPKTQVTSQQVTPALALSSPLSAIGDIVFTGGPLSEPVTLQATNRGAEDVKLAALSFGAATHIVRREGVFQLDQTYGVEIFGSLFGIPAKGIAGYNLSPEEVTQFGLDDPWMTVEYDMQNGADAQPRHCVLKLAAAGEGSWYAMLEGGGVVYEIGRQPFMDIQYEKLPLRWFLTPLLMDVSAVLVEGGGQSWRFDLDNTNARDPIVTYGDTRLNTPLFRSFFRLLTSAAHDGTYLGNLPAPGGDPLLTITYEYTNPEKAPDVLSLYPGEARRANVYVNGIGEFAMKDQFALRVLEGCANLLAGEAIEENW